MKTSNDSPPASVSHSVPVNWSSITPPRKGKIGRLPREIREQINLRLADGMDGDPLLAWLNSEKAVQDILRERFNSRPINKQNLSQWRNGGFLDWLSRQQTVELAHRNLAENAESIDEITDCGRFSERLATLMSVKLAQISTPLMNHDGHTLDQRWRRTRQVLTEFNRLRRSSYLSAKAKLEKEKLSLQSNPGLDRDVQSPE